MHSLITHFRTDRANLLEEKHDNRWWRHDGNLKYFASAVYSLSPFVCKQELLWLSAQQCLILNKLDYSLGKRVVLVFDPRDQINISVELNLNVCVFANEIWMNLSFHHGKQQSKYRKYTREYIIYSPPHKRYRVDPCCCTITEQTQDDSQVRIPQFSVHCSICVHVEMCDGLSCSCSVKSTTESKAFTFTCSDRSFRLLLRTFLNVYRDYLWLKSGIVSACEVIFNTSEMIFCTIE